MSHPNKTGSNDYQPVSLLLLFVLVLVLVLL